MRFGLINELCGAQKGISTKSAVRLRVGRLLWGKNTGLLDAAGNQVQMPDEIFYDETDRTVSEDVRESVMNSAIRTALIRREKVVVWLGLGAATVVAVIYIGIKMGVSNLYEQWKAQRDAQAQAQVMQQQAPQQQQPFGSFRRY